MKPNDLLNSIESVKASSAWRRGVKEYAYEIVEYVSDYYEDINTENAKEILLNGASSWVQYSSGGCSLIYDEDIAERLCSPSELKKATKKDGSIRDNANARESWLDVQARALNQAYYLIMRILRANK